MRLILQYSIDSWILNGLSVQTDYGTISELIRAPHRTWI
jgi:hypothetical protein